MQLTPIIIVAYSGAAEVYMTTIPPASDIRLVFFTNHRIATNFVKSSLRKNNTSKQIQERDTSITMTLPSTFKAAVFKAQGEPLTLEDLPMKEPGRGELLVKVEACGVCHSDSFAQNNAFGGGFPLIPGHEIIGRVAAVGPDVSGWEAGQRVGSGWHGGHDGTCKACNKGLHQMCDNKTINGITKNGGYAEYCVIRSEAAVRIPEHVDAAKYAPILCAGVTTYNSMRRQGIAQGETVAIQGLGGLGHLAIQYARRMGYHVVAISRGADKEKAARELGAHEYIDAAKDDPAAALQKLGGAALIVATAPHADAISPLIGGLDIMGKLLLLAVPGPLSVNIAAMLGKGCSVVTWPSGNALDSEEAIKFTDMQDVDCKIETFPLEKANDAYKVMMDGSVRFRSVVTMT
ncbi:uncharacterized protein PgNI_02989 [Pyricularia grisea]|uniref:Enoyl reductase (ER) domain-containing protein n=1 Tax=Pyricularia grisea TaxID=148305 RepID=A0A6P8BB86_PYRGI|nr:uncharacterized protein PgNI_02989 [Pyricularia grisea]TLD13090.1 hypothetical protein PgNI_02989 [Pyricularia grisea]